jgi:F-type H+-transporting ATPase subunit delta
MAELATLARPYARAAFEYARAHEQIGDWRDFLERLAELSELVPVHDLVTTPLASRARRAEVLLAIVGGEPPEGGENLLHLMADNGRLDVLAAVSEEFVRLEEEAEATAEVVVETAVELSEASSERLLAALGKRLGRELEAQFRVVPELIGGVVIRIGDEVIDASLATRLERLAGAMTA